MQALVLAAGRGTRMKSDRPKVLHSVGGASLLEHVLDALKAAGISRPLVVIGYGGEEVRRLFSHRADFVFQKEQRGTGHAVLCAERILKRKQEDLLICPGDMPLLLPETLRAFFQKHQQSRGAASVLSSIRENPKGYGRILRLDGQFVAIREELDATGSEKRINEVNTGVYLFKGKGLWEALSHLRPQNAKKELYLTDTIEIFLKEGNRVNAFPIAQESEGQGVNTRFDLIDVSRVMNQRNIASHLEKGVTIVSPEHTVIASGVRIGAETTIFPWSYIEKNVKIGACCQIGPFAKIRSGSVIGDGSVVGSFVEVNRSSFGKGVVAKHLAYLGDAVLGDGTNVGAGAVTANFDGKSKHKTVVGKRVFLGSNSVLVAPVHVADDVKTGAGSVVTARSKTRKFDVWVGVPARPHKK